jgi:hypothetical protein
MPKVEVRTRVVPATRSRGSRKRPGWDAGGYVLLEILLTPRGSGNRPLAVALANAAKAHPQLGPHVYSARAGYSKVWIKLTPSVQLARTMLEWNANRQPDVPGQLPLFGGPVPA